MRMALNVNTAEASFTETGPVIAETTAVRIRVTAPVTRNGIAETAETVWTTRTICATNATSASRNAATVITDARAAVKKATPFATVVARNAVNAQRTKFALNAVNTARNVRTPAGATTVRYVTVVLMQYVKNALMRAQTVLIFARTAKNA